MTFEKNVTAHFFKFVSMRKDFIFDRVIVSLFFGFSMMSFDSGKFRRFFRESNTADFSSKEIPNGYDGHFGRIPH